MKKAYCIIKKDGYVYFPIKAKSGPYYDKNGKLIIGYLAGMPNFFGGTVGGDQSIYSTLINEVSEESQGNINIHMSEGELENVCEKLYEFSSVKTNGCGKRIQTDYVFYSVNADSNPSSVAIVDFRNDNILKLLTDTSLDAKCREMSCILKIPVNQLFYDFRNFLDKCKEIGGEYLLDTDGKNGHNDWGDPGTQDAFKEFCKKYGKIDTIH